VVVGDDVTFVVTMTPEPSEFCTSSSSRGCDELAPRVAKEKLNGSRPYSRECRSFWNLHRYDRREHAFDQARRSLFNASSDATCFESTLGSTPACNFPLPLDESLNSRV